MFINCLTIVFSILLFCYIIYLNNKCKYIEDTTNFLEFIIIMIGIPAIFHLFVFVIFNYDLLKKELIQDSSYHNNTTYNIKRQGYGIFDSEIKADLYEIELRSLDGTLIDTIYPDLGTSFYPTDNIPLVKGNTVTYVLSGGEGGRGGNTYGTASAPIIIIKKR